MNTFLSWFRGSSQGSKGSSQGSNGSKEPDADTAKKSIVSRYNVVDAHNRVVIADLAEGQAINYCLQYRLHGDEVFVVEQVASTAPA